MKALITIAGVEITVSALAYPFPKAPKVAAEYHLVDEKGEKLELAQTGGGKNPTYIYFKMDGKSFYLPKNTTPTSGSAVKVVVETEKPAAPAAEASEVKAEKPARSKKVA